MFLMFRDQCTGVNYYTKVTNKYFENVSGLTFLETMLRNINCIHKEIKSSLNARNPCYCAVYNILSSRLPLKSLIKMCENNFTFCFVLLWNLVSHIKGTRSASENGVPMALHELMRNEVTGRE